MTAQNTPQIAAGSTWALDPARTTVGFSSKSIWGLVNVKGAFTDVSGEGQVDADGGARGVLAMASTSIDTKHEKRDKHLRSKDFFDVERHESIVFTANQVVARTAEDVEVTGELVVNGVAKPLGFSARIVEAHATAVVLTAELVIRREEFGMTWNQLGMMKPDTHVTITACFVPA